MILVGVLALGAIALIGQQSLFARWFLPHALAPERVLPLAALGIAGGLISWRAFGLALLFFVLGISAGLAAHDRVVFTLYTVLHGPTYLFLTGPISCLAIGLALVVGARPLPWLLPPAAFVDGAMLAVAIFLTNPTLDDPVFTWTPMLAAIWIVAGVSLTARAFGRAWLPIFGRILGSWTVAVGLLYGGALLMPILKPQPPPSDTSQESTRGIELNRSPEIGRSTTEQWDPSQMQPWRPPGGPERQP
jgi:hypothetical protein